MQNDLKAFVAYEVHPGPIKLVKTQVMHGANYFSAGPVICMRIDLGSFDEVFSNTIEGFYEKLTKALPTLYDHHCSPGIPGGFFKRVKEGTLMGHVMEHIAIELQTMAGMDVGYGKTRSTTEKGIYNVCYRFFDEIAGLYAGKVALNFINSMLQNQKFDIDQSIAHLVYIREMRLLGPSTQAIVDEVEKRHIPYMRLDAFNLVQLGTGKYKKSVRATVTSDTNFIAVDTSDNKYLTSRMLDDAGLPVLPTEICVDESYAVSFGHKYRKPIVLKPVFGSLGKCVFTRLENQEEIKSVFKRIKTDYDEVIVQPFHPGNAYRFLVIDYKVVAVSQLEPPFVIGNGKDTIKALIEKLNACPDRQFGDKGRLSKVVIDEMTLAILKKHNYVLDDVLPDGCQLTLKNSGSMQLGGIPTDVTEEVHPFNIFLAERAAKIIGLNVAGVDVLSNDISQPVFDNQAVILEVNAAPDFRMHMQPALNKSRPVATKLVNMLFPPNHKTRVPVFSVTGAEGTTLVVNMLNFVLSQEKHHVGMASTQGLFINNKRLKKGDMSNPESVSLVLKDPTIDLAVLETSLQGILRRGLGYKYADYAVVLNIDDKHIGQDDMEHIEDVAYAMSVVAEEVFAEGFTILNADQPLVFEMTERLYSKPAYFSCHKKQNKELQKHILQGGLAVTLEDDMIKLYLKHNVYDLVSTGELPVLNQKEAPATVSAVLAAFCSLVAFGIEKNRIKTYLIEFNNF